MYRLDLTQTLNISLCRRIQNHNDITVHFLTAIHEHQYLTAKTKQDFKHWERAKHIVENVKPTTTSLEIDKEAIVYLLSQESIRYYNDYSFTIKSDGNLARFNLNIQENT